MVQTKFEIDSPFLVDHSLYNFQHIGMNLATELERVLIQWDTGAGKSLLGSLVSQKLFDLGQIDLALVVCKRAKTVDWEEYVRDTTRLKVERVSSKWGRDKRHKRYRETDAECLVLNYEKFRYPTKYKSGPDRGKSDWSKTDLWQILSMCEGRRVLLVLDEAQKIGNKDSLVSRGLRGLMNPLKGAKRVPETVRVIALTATPYTTAPYNIRDIFLALKPGTPKVSGSKKEFDDEYVTEMGRVPGGYGQDREYVKRWNDGKLKLLGKRIEGMSHVAMKSDPVIAAQFPKMAERQLTLDLSESDQRVYDAVLDLAFDEWGDNNRMANLGNFQLLRMICNTSESLRYSQSALARELVESGEHELGTGSSAKYGAVESLCETILEADDKIVLFTFWANAVLKPYAAGLKKKFDRVPIFEYAGTTMSEDQQEYAKREFNAAKGGAVLIMSDAGQEGLNLYAPYLAHIEMPYTYSAYKQRRDRIHRSDSIVKGIDHVWIYRYVVRNTVEQKVDDRVFQRKHHAELIQGTPDVVLQEDTDTSMGDMAIYKMMFGDRAKR